MTSNPDLSLLDEPYPLSDEQVDRYRENAFVKLRNVFTPEILEHFRHSISEMVSRLKKDRGPMESRDTYGKAFIQVANLWTRSDAIKRLVLSPRLGRIAAELMGVDGVRLYHDQALFKEPGGGFTPWHADQYYWPLVSQHCATVWIPLQATPLEMGPLEFSAGSHHMTAGRHLQIGDESEKLVDELVSKGGYNHVAEPFEIGEVSFQAGWLYHRAGPNRTDTVREAMTIIYMDREMRLAAPKNEHQRLDAEVWCPGVRAGEIIDSPLNPTIYWRG